MTPTLQGAVRIVRPVALLLVVLAALAPRDTPVALAALGPRDTPNALPSPDPASAETERRILFVSNREGGTNGATDRIYSARPDGSDVRRLSDQSSDDADASPDGTRIAVVVACGPRSPSGSAIQLLSRDGRPVGQATGCEGRNRHPRFSPDGRRIVFWSDRTGTAQIYVVGTDGRGLTRLTSNAAQDLDPCWSPRGELAFTSDRDGARAVYVMRADGTQQRRLTDGTVAASHPDWSHRGDRIVFSGYRRDDGANLYSIATAGGTAKRLTDAGFDIQPAFSPDDVSIAFTRVLRENAVRNSEVFVVGADGSDPRRLTTSARFDEAPRWLPPPRPAGAARAAVPPASAW